jgi:single-strand DNA-binding protein
MSKIYELFLILNPTATEADEKKITDLIKKTVKDGSIKKTDNLGKKAFAYPIGKQREGTYVLHTITCDGEAIVSLRKVLALEQSILRFIILTLEERKKKSKDAVKSGKEKKK